MTLISCHARTGFANCYVVGPDDGGPAAIIDPGHFDAGLLERVERIGLKIVAVLLTHSHRAHAGGVGAVLSVYRARVYGGGGSSLAPDQTLQDGQTVAVGGLEFEARALPRLRLFPERPEHSRQEFAHRRRAEGTLRQAARNRA